MLNKTKILQELQNRLPEIFINTEKSQELIRHLWDYIINNNISYEQLKAVTNKQLIPKWHEQINVCSNIGPEKEYTAIAVDGSQIYPDRHQGIACYLLNIGICQISYGLKQSEVILKSDPQLNIVNKDSQSLPNIIDAQREELEFSTALDIGKKLIAENQVHEKLLFLFDGSLVFWHLEKMEDDLKQKFINSYLDTFKNFYENKLLMASYISLPKSKDLVNVLSNALILYNKANDIESQRMSGHGDLDYVTDNDIANLFLQPGTRSIVFEYQGPLAIYYPEHLKPHFFYMHVNNEIARIEIPSWIAKDSKYLQIIETIILDQAVKGYGYPVVLSEAHEQAVIKSADRQLFYDMLYSITKTHNKDYVFSQKSLKKRRSNI